MTYVSNKDLGNIENVYNGYIENNCLDSAQYMLDGVKQMWNNLNSGLTDVEDIDVLYTLLKHMVSRMDWKLSMEYDNSRGETVEREPDVELDNNQLERENEMLRAELRTLAKEFEACKAKLDKSLGFEAEASLRADNALFAEANEKRRADGLEKLYITFQNSIRDLALDSESDYIEFGS